jgi:hypothetical protein
MLRLIRLLRSLSDLIDLRNCPAILAPPLAPPLDSFALKWATSQYENNIPASLYSLGRSMCL